MSWDSANNIFVPSIVHCNGIVHTMLIFTREDYFYLVLFAKFPFQFDFELVTLEIQMPTNASCSVQSQALITRHAPSSYYSFLTTMSHLVCM